MSYSSDAQMPVGKAEHAFRDAFVRLKNGCPTVLPNGAQVSQNSVAKEAGRDPTALKKARFPELIREIQEWVENGTNTATSPKPNRDTSAKIAKLEGTIASLLAQRDRLASELLSAKYKIFEQWQKIQRLEASEQSTVVDLRGRRINE